MHPKILLTQKLKIVVLLGLLLFLSLFLCFYSKDLNLASQKAEGASVVFSENVVTSIKQEQTKSDLPMRLKIPKIQVDAKIEHIGLAPNGAMDVPIGTETVAWFNLNPRPGEKGNAVISGHYGWKNNIPAVFDNLHKLTKGDKIYVENENKETTVFVVRKIQTYGKDEKVPDIFNSSDDKAHLNLITCGGVWNEEKKSYSNRIVIFSDLEE